MKKVLIVADTYFPKVDGILRFLEEIVPRLEDDFEVTLLVPDYGVGWYKNEVKVALSRVFRLAGYSSIKLSFGTLRKIKNAVEDTNVVFVQGPALLSLLAVYYAKKHRKTAMSYVHLITWEIYEKNLPRLFKPFVVPLLKWLTKWHYNTCDLLVVPYRRLVADLNLQGVTTKKVVVSLGVDNKGFCPADNKDEAKRALGIDPSYTVIGYVGRISPEKNVTVLLDVVRRLQRKHKVFLLAVGSGTKKMMEIFGGVKNALLPGFVEDVGKYYRAMDIFVMPSMTETTSLATLEAMACGVPVVTTKVGFLQEYVIKDFNGLLFPKGNEFTLVLQLQKLLERKELREFFGKNARSTAISFSWDKTATKIKELLERY